MRTAALPAAVRGAVLRSLLRQPRCRAWKEAVDAASGRTYHYHDDGRVQWEAPSAEEAEQTAPPAPPSAPKDGLRSAFDLDALTALLLPTPGVRLLDVIESNGLREEAFSDEYTDHLTALIARSDAETAEQLSKLRARLANPLIRQPPHF